MSLMICWCLYELDPVVFCRLGESVEGFSGGWQILFQHVVISHCRWRETSNESMENSSSECKTPGGRASRGKCGSLLPGQACAQPQSAHPLLGKSSPSQGGPFSSWQAFQSVRLGLAQEIGKKGAQSQWQGQVLRPASLPCRLEEQTKRLQKDMKKSTDADLGRRRILP